MIKATKNAAGGITIEADRETAEIIWALAEAAEQDPDNRERTRGYARETAAALEPILKAWT